MFKVQGGICTQSSVTYFQTPETASYCQGTFTSMTLILGDSVHAWQGLVEIFLLFTHFNTRMILPNSTSADSKYFSILVCIGMLSP